MGQQQNIQMVQLPQTQIIVQQVYHDPIQLLGSMPAILIK